MIAFSYFVKILLVESTTKFWSEVKYSLFVFIGIIVLWQLNQLIFRKLKFGAFASNITKPLISIAIIFFGFIAFVISLGLEPDLQKEIISLLAILLSAGIALSSTTVLGNMIAGLMNSTMRRFQYGDMIRIGEHMGRVTKKGIFHTEIQAEDGNFVNLPNMYVARHPVKFTRNTNTLVSCTISIGYDEPRLKIEELLIKAARKAKINAKEPFVFISRLGDYSVEYKLHGFLKDSKDYFSACSRMKEQVIDQLHQNNIEIVSPAFVNQRILSDKKIIGKSDQKELTSNKSMAHDNLLFYDANKAGALAKRKSELLEELKSEVDPEIIEKKKSEISCIEQLQKENEKPS